MKKSSPSFKWRDELRLRLVSIITEVMKEGNFTDSSFKKTTWDNIVKKFNNDSNIINATKSQLQSEVSKTKKEYLNYKLIKKYL